TLVVQQANEAVIYFSAKTSFKDNAFRQHAQQLLDKAKTIAYDQQKKKHITNFQKLFNRQQVYLGRGGNDALPTDKRLENFYNAATPDNGLTVLFYQFSRYLTISSTRVGL